MCAVCYQASYCVHHSYFKFGPQWARNKHYFPGSVHVYVDAHFFEAAALHDMSADGLYSIVRILV